MQMFQNIAKSQLQIAVNPVVEICFQKYFGRVITIASTLDPVFFVVPKLMSTGAIICGIIFWRVCYNYLLYPTTSRSRPSYLEQNRAEDAIFLRF